MSKNIPFKKAMVYYFPRLRNFGLVKEVKNGVVTLISPFYGGDEPKEIVKVDSKEHKVKLSYIINDGIVLIDGQTLVDKNTGEKYVIGVAEDKSIKIRKIKIDGVIDIFDMVELIKEENSGDTSRIETVYRFDGNFEDELTVERLLSITSLIGGGSGTIELDENIYQVYK